MGFEIFEQVFNWNVYISIRNSWVYNQILKSAAEVNLTSQFKSAWTSSSSHVGSALYDRFKQNEERWWTLNTGLGIMLKSTNNQSLCFGGKGMVYPTFHDLGHLMVLPSSSEQSICWFVEMQALFLNVCIKWNYQFK